MDERQFKEEIDKKDAIISSMGKSIKELRKEVNELKQFCHNDLSPRISEAGM